MTIPCNEYVITHTVAEALRILSESHGEACLVSGGSDLLLELQQGLRPPVDILVDVSEIDELCSLEMRESELFIGASVTLARLAGTPLVGQHATALSDAAALMGNPQVCNVATIGGNVAHALPAADGTIALLALDAQVELASIAGRRKVPLQTLFRGPGESTLDPCGDLLVGFYLPPSQPGQSSAFARRVNPQGIALAMLNLALWLEREEGQIIDIRIAVGPSGPVPMRMLAAEKALARQTYSDNLLDDALEELLKEALLRTSPHRATATYRRQLAGVLFHEAFTKAWERAK